MWFTVTGTYNTMTPNNTLYGVIVAVIVISYPITSCVYDPMCQTVPHTRENNGRNSYQPTQPRQREMCMIHSSIHIVYYLDSMSV